VKLKVIFMFTKTNADFGPQSWGRKAARFALLVAVRRRKGDIGGSGL
jgi:hypothetical protein